MVSSTWRTLLDKRPKKVGSKSCLIPRKSNWILDLILASYALLVYTQQSHNTNILSAACLYLTVIDPSEPIEWAFLCQKGAHERVLQCGEVSLSACVCYFFGRDNRWSSFMHDVPAELRRAKKLRSPKKKVDRGAAHLHIYNHKAFYRYPYSQGDYHFIDL